MFWLADITGAGVWPALAAAAAAVVCSGLAAPVLRVYPRPCAAGFGIVVFAAVRFGFDTVSGLLLTAADCCWTVADDWLETVFWTAFDTAVDTEAGLVFVGLPGIGVTAAAVVVLFVALPSLYAAGPPPGFGVGIRLAWPLLRMVVAMFRTATAVSIPGSRLPSASPVTAGFSPILAIWLSSFRATRAMATTKMSQIRILPSPACSIAEIISFRNAVLIIIITSILQYMRHQPLNISWVFLLPPKPNARGAK